MLLIGLKVHGYIAPFSIFKTASHYDILDLIKCQIVLFEHLQAYF